MRCSRVVLSAACAAAVLGPASSAPICIQAESFDCDAQAWVVRDQASRYAPDSGLRHLYGAAGGDGVATRELELGEAGRYSIWVRHTVMRGEANRGPFALTIKQGERVVAEGRFDDTSPEKDPVRIHRYDWSRFEADLPAGKLRLELSKLPPANCSGWTRYVEVEPEFFSPGQKPPEPIDS